MKYELVIFDLDGTLLDTQEGIVESLKEAFQELKEGEVKEDVIRKFIGPPLIESFRKYMGYDEEQARRAADIFKPIYQKKGVYQASVYPGVEQTLTSLRQKGVKTAVATNKTHENAVKILKNFELYDKFDIVQGNLGYMTKQDSIRICMEFCQKPAEKCILIGDSRQDEKGAESSGIDFIAVTYGFGYKPSDDNSTINCVKVCSQMEEVEKEICS